MTNLESTPQGQAVRTLEWGSSNRPIIPHVVLERYNCSIYCISLKQMDFAALPRNATLKLIIFDRRDMGGLGLTFVIHHKQKKRFVMSYEESTRAITDAQPITATGRRIHLLQLFYCYATTFNMNAAKNQQQSHFRLHNNNYQSTTPVTT